MGNSMHCQAVLQDRPSSERTVSQGQHGGNRTWDKGQRGNESLIGASTGLLVSVNKQLAWLELTGQLHTLLQCLLSFYRNLFKLKKKFNQFFHPTPLSLATTNLFSVSYGLDKYMGLTHTRVCVCVCVYTHTGTHA